MLMDNLLDSKSLNGFANVLYNVSNITPIPDIQFNIAKGQIAKDSLTIFIEIIKRNIANKKAYWGFFFCAFFVHYPAVYDKLISNQLLTFNRWT